MGSFQAKRLDYLHVFFSPYQLLPVVLRVFEACDMRLLVPFVIIGTRATIFASSYVQVNRS
jgi:hypothetical protein